VDEEEFEEFQREYKRASDSPGKNRDELMEQVADQFECDLEILGATALEDKLQVGVPEAIEKLHEAGIKLWILTGDKLQTAIEIGYSCNLLKNTMEIMILSSDTEAGARSQIEQGLEKLMSTSGSATSSGHFDFADREDRAPDSMGDMNKDELGNTSNERNKSQSALSPARPKDGYAVVIDGDTLRYALDGSLKSNFLALTVQCETVVCCRVSPAQKALTVKLVKEGKNAMTLAIGDGKQRLPHFFFFLHDFPVFHHGLLTNSCLSQVPTMLQ
jgi:phospholipid-translocating ATPase